MVMVTAAPRRPYPHDVSREDLERVHREMGITVPLDQASPLLLATLAVVAHCWLPKERKFAAEPAHTFRNLNVPARRRSGADLKRLAANDFD
ncbi:hypothetical protein A2G96_05780 [Cupriavidus nantongensis]|uniref:Uncharacterized protein n=1 Tax=Cupriavidus nantongensis TaxID=1796606 RepID=A0A142JGR8_9BURK|nr:hypothetical protein A2G96_05780 [Cupriavidus nantongensis]